MADAAFFPKPEPLTLREIIDLTSAELRGDASLDTAIRGVATLDSAGPADICFAEGARYIDAAKKTRAGACFTNPRFAEYVSAETAILVVPDPHRALALVSSRLYPAAMRPLPVFAGPGIATGAIVHPTAKIAKTATIEPGAVIGPGAEIGEGASIAPTAVIGPGVRIGRDVSIGIGATAIHATIGDRTIVHPGVRIGQDGFGFIAGPDKHLKTPQIGGVVIGEDVEIGAGTTIDRGAIRDTVIGDGTKIDNLVQIGHNVRIGRRCLIVSQVGISGSVTIEDLVVIGGKSGLNGHITVGKGAQIAAVSSVYRDVPPGARWAGSPARPLRDWLRAQSRDLRYGKKSANRDE